MAAAHRKGRKTAASPKTGVNEADPQSWLYLNPLGSPSSGLIFGVLRRIYQGRTNTAVEFGRRKLQPIQPLGDAAASPWPVTAEHSDVVLPPTATGMSHDPETLLRLADACAVDHMQALLVYLTLPFLAGESIPAGWERCRAFVRENFARDRHLAALLVCHAPGRAGSPRPPHCHALIIPRRIEALGIGHGVYDRELVHDQGQALVEALWVQHMETFR